MDHKRNSRLFRYRRVYRELEFAHVRVELSCAVLAAAVTTFRPISAPSPSLLEVDHSLNSINAWEPMLHDATDAGKFLVELAAGVWI
jgi:hypothetical protein